MIQPPSPVTIQIAYTHYKAVDLPTDEGSPLSKSSVILRHRHLRQQHGVASIIPTTEGPPSKHTKGVTVNFGGPLALEVPPAPQPNQTSGPSTQRDIGPNAGHGQDVMPAGRSLATAMVPNAPNTRSKPYTSVRRLEILPIIEKDSSSLPQVSSDPQLGGPARTTEDVVSRTGSDEKLHVVRKEHSIRSTREKTVWFESRGRSMLSTPETVPLARFGDLYVHNSLDVKQVWLRTAEQQWLKIDIYHPHPWLPGYKLHFIANGEPRWVTQDSLQTYKTRMEKRKREAEALREQKNRMAEGQRKLLPNGKEPADGGFSAPVHGGTFLTIIVLGLQGVETCGL
ncbi:hypothetical protein BV20DRAFT_1058394 [Pilatotrama ljubarskyi]|nr:hypothetical protein BV20DRAFT_1058394 [Pilatotrama ljubarskyi]